MSVWHQRFANTTVLILGLLATTACGGKLAGTGADLRQPIPPTAAELSSQLEHELTRLGIDAAKAVAQAPGPGNSVFDLTAVVIDPDGEGGAPPVGVELAWTERLIGDYDQNGEVNAADLAPLGQHFGAVVRYRDIDAAGGLEWWPEGNPQDDGAADSPLPPDPLSPAENWRLARIDGDFGGELGLPDITPIAMHWKERLDGYRVYRRTVGETEYQLLPNPDDPASPVTLPRSTAFPAGATDADPARPVRYRYRDSFDGYQDYEYYVVAYDGVSDGEGRGSSSGAAQSNRPPVADLTATPAVGTAPLTVSLDASGSSDPEGALALFEWDYDNDGTWDAQTGNFAQFTYKYHAGGQYWARVRVTDAGGATAEDLVEITVYGPPQAVLSATPAAGSSPLPVQFDASGSTADGQIVEYAWDFDGDGAVDTTSGTTPTVAHTYPMGGAYHARVIVRDDQGLTSSAEQVIRIDNPPVARLTADATEGYAPLTVNFSAADSHGVGNEIVEYLFLPGHVTGTSQTTPLFSHTYESVGNYTASVLVRDANGLTDSYSLEIRLRERPISLLGLNAEPSSGPYDLSVELTAAFAPVLNQDFFAYEWYFDEWQYESPIRTTERTITHVYHYQGQYNPRVRIRYEDGSYSDFASTTIEVISQPPAAVINYSYVSGTPLTALLNASASTDDESDLVYEWDPDSSGTFLPPSTDPSLTYSYSIPSAVIVKLRVTDLDGNQDEATLSITPNSPPAVSVNPGDLYFQTDVQRQFTINGSDDNGDILYYEIDLDGDGNADLGPQTSNTFSLIFNEPTIQYIQYSVSDGYGSVENSCAMNVYNWKSYTNQSSSSGSANILLGSVSGMPAIFNYWAYSQCLFSKATDTSGTNWMDSISASGNYVHQNWAAALFSADPCIFVSEKVGNEYHIVLYRSQPGSGGSAWEDGVDFFPQIIHFPYITYCSMVTGMIGSVSYIMIMYPDLSNNYHIFYSYSNDGNRAIWSEPVQLPIEESQAPDARSKLSFVNANGKPGVLHVASVDDGGNISSNIKFTRANDPLGLTWLNPVEIYGPLTGYASITSSIQVDDHPAFVYCANQVSGWNSNSDDVWYCSAVDGDGLVWNAPQEVGDGLNTYYKAKLVVKDNLPVLAAITFGYDGSLIVKEATQADGSNWSADRIVYSETYMYSSHPYYDIYTFSNKLCIALPGVFLVDD